MKQQKTIRPLTLSIDRKLWNQFKTSIPRTTTLNEAVVSLIREKITPGGIDFSEKPFLAKDGDSDVVLYAGGSKAKEFERRKDAQAFLRTCLQDFRT